MIKTFSSYLVCHIQFCNYTGRSIFSIVILTTIFIVFFGLDTKNTTTSSILLLPIRPSNHQQRISFISSLRSKRITEVKKTYVLLDAKMNHVNTVSEVDGNDNVGTTLDVSSDINEIDSIIKSAKEWIVLDPNPTTVAYVQRLITEKDYVSLKLLFPIIQTTSSNNNNNSCNRISFGTAGLRGKMLPGPYYMNDLVVIQTAQGIASYCKSVLLKMNDTESSFTTKRPRLINDGMSSPHSTSLRTGNKLGVAIGYDHRATSKDTPYQLSSLQFALYTKLVFQNAGFDDVLLFDGYIATPMIPFTVVQYDKIDASTMGICYIGIMITASHNPKDDAGYKIYWTDGCQIQSPVDQEIASHIQQNLNPWIDYSNILSDIRQAHDNINSTDPCYGLSDPKRTEEIISEYYKAILNSGLLTDQVSKWDTQHSKLPSTEPDTTVKDSNNSLQMKPPTFCYTAMHGVGYKFAQRIFHLFNLPDFCSVPTQQDPDPNFPTVTFPNPEEKGALDIAKLHAETNGCDIILANDPDADRLAVAERDRSSGLWTIFTGDQIGAMLGHWLWQTQSSDDPNIVVAMCASTVSSRLLSEIARVENFHYEVTLTGFKWIGSRAAALHNTPVTNQTQKRYKTIFCYEEAIGFCCGNVIFDKDGISALAVFAELSYATYRQNMNLGQYMQSLYDKYGEFVSNNGYYFVSSPSVVMTVLDRITNNGKFDTLQNVGPYKVSSVRYLGVPGYDSSQPDLKPILPCSKSSPMIMISFDNGCIAQFRGSGTEPKFKYYIELQGQPGISRNEVKQELDVMSNIILEELLQPEKNGLRRK